MININHYCLRSIFHDPFLCGIGYEFMLKFTPTNVPVPSLPRREAERRRGHLGVQIKFLLKVSAAPEWFPIN